MSHFTVMVVGGGVEEQLAPFQENNMSDCPAEYLEFDIQYHKKEFKKDALKVIAGMEKDYKENGKKSYVANNIIEYRKLMKEKKYGDFLQKQGGYSKDSDGNLGYMLNLNSKWDWYQIGGRWAGRLKLKKGAKSGTCGEKSWGHTEDPYADGRVDSALVKDIDFKAMQEDPKEKEGLEKHWDEVISGKGMYKPEYFLKRYKTKEEYVRQNMLFSTHSVLIDGEWSEAGEMGWWGFSSETEEQANNWDANFFKNFIEKLDPETRITIVDCHI